jgi:hypothetical protein
MLYPLVSPPTVERAIDAPAILVHRSYTTAGGDRQTLRRGRQSC